MLDCTRRFKHVGNNIGFLWSANVRSWYTSWVQTRHLVCWCICIQVKRFLQAQRILSRQQSTDTKECMMFEELDHYHHELTNFAVEAKLSLFFFPFASVTGKVDYFRQRTSTKYKKIIFYQTRRVAYSKKIVDETTTQLVDDINWQIYMVRNSSTTSTTMPLCKLFI